MQPPVTQPQQKEEKIEENKEQLDKEQKENQNLLKEILSEVDFSFHFISGTSVEPAINIFVESRDKGLLLKGLNILNLI